MSEKDELDPLREERAAAAGLLAELLQGPPQWWRTAIFAKPDALTYGFAVALVKQAVSLLDSAPAEALEAAAIAVDVAERLRVDAYPADLVINARADAWREYAYTLFYVGRLNEAADAVDVAEKLLRQSVVSEIELARTALIRASVLRARDRVAEAIPLAEQASVVFRRFGDRHRYVKARVIEGNLRYQSGAIADALAIWLELETEPSLQNTDTLGLLFHNVGHAYRDQGDFANARVYLDRAIESYGAHEMNVEKVRTRWVIGQMLILQGDVSAGLPILRVTWREFEKLGMELEAGLVGLEMAEALLIAGHTDEVVRICRTILDRFVREGMMSRAITALAYLREAIAAEKLTPGIVRDVREFLRALPRNPGRSPEPPRV